MNKQNRADHRKYHFIYKTTNLINNKYYIGMHSTDNLNDGYLGSGSRLWRSIKHYGKENFKVEILEHLSDRKTLKQREAELVHEELLKDSLCMNLALGGGYQWPTSQTPKARLSRTEGLKKFWNSNEGKVTRERINVSIRNRMLDPKVRQHMSLRQKTYRNSRSLDEKLDYSKKMQDIWASGTELNQEQIKRVKESWKTETHRNSRIDGMNKTYAETDLRIIRSVDSKQMWNTPGYRENFCKIRTGLKYEKTKTKNEELRIKILNTLIDVSKPGWSKLLSLEVNRSENTVRNLVKNTMPDLWNKCYSRFKES